MRGHKKRPLGRERTTKGRGGRGIAASRNQHQFTRFQKKMQGGIFVADERQAAYWAVIPARVLYDNDLRPNAKLLYAEITALAVDAGYCYASNSYMGQFFGLSTKTVGDLVSALAKKGYVTVEVIRDEETNEVIQRRIWVEQTAGGTPIPLPPKMEGGPPKNGGTPPSKNGEKINISNIYTPLNPPKGGRRRKAKSEPQWKPERFEAFWEYYRTNCRGEDRMSAVREWDKLRLDDETIAIMGLALKRQVRYWRENNGIGVPYACRYLKHRRWEDSPPPDRTPSPGATGTGAVESELPTW